MSTIFRLGLFAAAVSPALGDIITLKPSDTGRQRPFEPFTHGDVIIGGVTSFPSLDQSVLEFGLPDNLFSAQIQSAQLVLDNYIRIEYGGPNAVITWRADGYAGDGIAAASDLNLGSPVTPNMMGKGSDFPLNGFSVLDVTAFLISLAHNNAGYAGFVLHTLAVSGGPTGSGLEVQFGARDMGGTFPSSAPQLRITYAAVPESGSTILLMTGVVAVLFLFRRLLSGRRS